MDPKKDRVCFVCGKSMEVEESLVKSYKEGEKEVFLAPPDGGTRWESPGNYGSTVLDYVDMGRTAYRRAVFFLCDECLKERKDRVLFVERLEWIRTLEVKPWDTTVD